MPTLQSSAAGVIKFLGQQDELSSGTEQLSGSNRADTFTYHHADGRGARWHDSDRGLLWLLSLLDQHDRGYEHALDLQAEGALYPVLDPLWEPAVGTLLPWEQHVDEDVYEWARLIYGALQTFDINSGQLKAGDRISHPGPAHLELIYDGDIWTLTIRRRLGYMPPESRRARWLTNREIEELFAQIAGRPDRADYEFDNPPHPESFLFADVHFINGPLSPDAWLKQASDEALAGRPPLPLAQHNR